MIRCPHFCYPLMREGKQTHKTEEDNLLFEGHWIGFSNSRHVDLTRILKNRWLSYSSVSLCSRDDIKTFHYQGIQPDGGRCTRVYSRATPEVGAASAHSQLSSRDPPHADGVSAVFGEHSWVYPQTRPVAGHPLLKLWRQARVYHAQFHCGRRESVEGSRACLGPVSGSFSS